jgi:hypothetical protein
MAVATSEAGSARRFRMVGVEDDPTGVENNLPEASDEFKVTERKIHLHPDAFCNTTQSS